MADHWNHVLADAKLVSLPDVYLRLKTVLDDPDFTMGDVAAVIDKDPGMTVRLLRMVNSAYFGLAAKIETVSRAVGMLGTQQVHDLVLATSVTETFEGMSSEVMDVHRFWRGSVYCGVVARLLAYECNVLDSERMFVAGLLRDIGHLIMYQSIPDLSQQAMERAVETGAPIHKVEQELIGFDYAQIGGLLMSQWGLPESLQESTKLHVDPGEAEEFPLATGIVHLASLMAESAMADEGPEVWQSRVDVTAWHATDLSLQQCVACREEAERQVDQVLRLIIPQDQRAVG